MIGLKDEGEDFTPPKNKRRKQAMKNKLWKRIAAVGLAAAMTAGLLAGCGGKGGSGKGGSDDTKFTWWIYQIDGEGQYYQKYEENPVVQWVNQQYWDTEKGGLGKEGSGTKLDFSFIVPVGGSQSENFNTMIGTGEYPEVMDLSVSPDTPKTLCEDGVLIELTEYVEKYMPNYLAYLDEHPDLKPFVQSVDEDGEVHYYAIYGLKDGIDNPWYGPSYRRDWVVKYAEPTEYVWDWESDYVKENGHPAVTPLSEAKKANNLEGWKKNEVTKFEAVYGEDPDQDYTDNVVFPSGTNEPLTISDWEWMFEAFAKALEIRGELENSSAYCTTIYYMGALATGDLVSSFGGGTGTYYVRDGKVSFDGASENFQTYIECVSNWYDKGWLDKQFETRSSEVFFATNSVGVNQGLVGLWSGLTSSLGAGIRSTCKHEEDQKDAYAMAARYPINDVYGGEAQKYVEPDAMYQDGQIASPVGVTTKAEGKDLAALFTFIDWTYSKEGGATLHLGLTEEQYKSMEFDPDVYADNGFDKAYTTETDENGMFVYKWAKEAESLVPLDATRFCVGLNPANNEESREDNGAKKVFADSYQAWGKYKATGSVMNYGSLLSSDENKNLSKINTAVNDYEGQKLPSVIKGETSWDEYAEGLAKIDTESMVGVYQKYIDLAK